MGPDDPPERSVRVLCDVPAVERAFDYSLPAAMAGAVEVGTVVRVPLHGRRVRGWVLDPHSVPPPGVALSPVAKVSGRGPDAATIDLCRWVAWRWAGRLPTVLRVATPDRAVRSVGRITPRGPAEPVTHPCVAEALGRGAGVHVVRLAPAEDPLPVALALAGAGQCLVVHPSVTAFERIGRGLRRAGASVCRWPRDWAAAAGGATVVGGRATVFAPAPALAAVVVFDEHDEGLQNESSPTWHAREVAVERARRAGVPCLLVSPAPSPEALALASGPVITAGRSRERAGWATVHVVDRRSEDTGRTGLFSPELVRAAREELEVGGRVVAVLNRTGRARLLACRSCGSVAECERCGAAVHLTDELVLGCGHCGATRPGVCLGCGSTALSVLRPGVGRAREELEALLRVPVEAVTGGGPAGPGPDLVVDGARAVIGTEAVLHRVSSAGLVAFLDMDQELLAPRYRAAEEALGLLVLASRVVGGRDGRVLVQTRRPDHEVLRAAVSADPAPFAVAEVARRELLGFPPAATVAVVGGEAAPEFVARLGRPLGVEVLGPDDGRWLLRSRDRAVLLDALAAVDRPPGRLRLRVDPVRT